MDISAPRKAVRRGLIVNIVARAALPVNFNPLETGLEISTLQKGGPAFAGPPLMQPVKRPPPEG